MADEVARPRRLPSVQELCINVPLYERFEFDEVDWEEVAELRFYRGHVDAHCLGCGQDATFRASNAYGSYTPHDAIKNALFSQWFECARNSKHKIVFIFRVQDQVLQKIGQSPSIADLSQPQLRKYRSVLDKNSYSELTRAVGLAAHGVGIGAFIYLRRIFERLIDNAAATASTTPGWDGDAYAKGRMDEKIHMLRDSLPAFLVTNRSLYGILSRGVHELSEEDCLAAFPAARLAIELILDAQLELTERKKKMREAEKAIEQLRSKQ